MNTSLYAPLRAVLEDSRASGAFPDCVPADDAPTIHAIAWRLVSEALSGAIRDAGHKNVFYFASMREGIE